MPVDTVVHCECGIRSAEQHHAAAEKVDVARAPSFTIAAQRGADLLHDVRCEARFIAIDLRNCAFETDGDFECVSTIVIG